MTKDHTFNDAQPPLNSIGVELDSCRHAVATIESNRTFSTTQNHNLSFYQGKVAGLEFALAAQPPAAPVETLSPEQWVDKLREGTEFAETPLSRCSADNESAPRDWFGDLNERVGKGLNAPLEPSSSETPAVVWQARPKDGSVDWFQCDYPTEHNNPEHFDYRPLYAGASAFVAALAASEDRLRNVEGLRMGDVAMEFQRLRETLFAKSDLAKGPNTEPQPSAATGDDPTAGGAWNDGCDFAMTQLCIFLGVDQNDVRWDAATETVDGDVQAVIGNILRAKFGEDWGPDVTPTEPQSASMREVLVSAQRIIERDFPNGQLAIDIRNVLAASPLSRPESK